MVQTRIEERLEMIDQEIVGMKREISKMPTIEISLSEISKNLELMRLQLEKQQQMLLTMMETNVQERSAMKEKTIGTPTQNAENNKRKENEASSSKTEESKRKFEDDLNERKSKSDENYSDRNKFKKVEMHVFTGEDPDSWLFRAERYFQIHKAEEFSQNDGGSPASGKQREFQKGSKLKWAFRQEKFCSNTWRKNTTINTTGETKGNTTFPIRTITLRSPAQGENRREGTYKRLPNAEFQIRKEKGLCFRCNEKYSADHKCKMKEHRELRMFVVTNDQEEPEIVDGDEVKKGELNTIEVKGDTTTFVELSINSMIGLNDPGTMKVRGKLRDEDVIILIDCGATHNFVSEKLVKKLFIPIKETAHYGVILGSRAAVQIKGIWVTTVGWKNLLPTFSVKGKPIKIQEDPSLTKARVNLENMIKAWGVDDEGFLVECRAIELVTPVNNDCHTTHMEIETNSSLNTMLKQFEDVFEWPEKLPPRREIEHQIHLKQGTDPINVRPYRYGFQQKEEMKKLVKEMLESGVIRPSNNPFSSPVLLVKKKDGSWSFV
ncbi:peroxidase 64 [Cucumis melo var. makuwa]|uniref:Peroxidase 64 n=1 Tax=Cucumis melo var. makuwa TaxID=1194695 RepID=A0A5D3DBF5_CUCMM|nr:peroxidase 64 [Cucumis melo var. makuwa]TYK20886.1 peroxidase 64 [Cucumis melo var. makuwa]